MLDQRRVADMQRAQAGRRRGDRRERSLPVANDQRQRERRENSPGILGLIADLLELR
jgi:hypothetical protein